MGKDKKRKKKFKGTTVDLFSATKKTNKTPAKYSASSEGTTSAETSPEEERKRKIPRKLGLGLPVNNPVIPENQVVFDTISSPEAVIDEDVEPQTNNGVMESTSFVFPSWENFNSLSPTKKKQAFEVIQREYFSTKQRLDVLETSNSNVLTEIKEMKRQISSISARQQQKGADVVPSLGVVQPLPDDAPFEVKFKRAMEIYENEKEEREFEREEKAKKKNNFVVYGLPLNKESSSEQREEDDRKIIHLILEKAGHSPDVISRFFRMRSGNDGQGNSAKLPALLKVELNSEAAKKAVMRNQRIILDEIPELNRHRDEFSQYLRDDLTFKEREHYGRLAKDRNALNAQLKEGEPRWKVYKFTLTQHVSNFQGNGENQI